MPHTYEYEERELTLPIVCEFHWSAPTPPTSSWNCPMGEPGDPGECNLEKVLLYLPREKVEKMLAETKGPAVGIDIMELMQENDLEKLEEDLFEIGLEQSREEQKEWDRDDG